MLAEHPVIARNLTYKAAWLCDQGRPYHVEATMAKLVGSEGALNAARRGVEILGGYGICTEYPMQRFLRDSLLIQFAPISNQMSRNILMQCIEAGDISARKRPRGGWIVDRVSIDEYNSCKEDDALFNDLKQRVKL